MGKLQWAAQVLALVTIAAVQAGGDDRNLEQVGSAPLLPVPAAADQRGAERMIREAFRREYSARSAEQRAEFAARLLMQAEETRDDSVARYVLLREARDIA